MPNGDTQDYVIKTAQNTYRIRVPKGMEQGKVLSLAAASNEKFATEYPAIQAHMKTLGFIKEDEPRPAPLGYTDPAAQRAFKSSMAPTTKALTEGTGAVLGGELVEGVEGVRLLPALMRMLATGTGGGVGNVAGNVITGQKPTASEAVKTGAGFAAGQGIGEVASPFLRWLTSSKSTGAKLLQMAEAKAGNVPVELSPKTNEIVEQIVEQGKLGGKTPKVVTDLLERVGPSERMSATARPGPLTYREARILQGNASSLTAEESAALKGRTKGLLKQFSSSFAQDVQKTADSAGVGKQHAAGMKEYAMASSRNRVLTKAAKATAAGATTIGGYELLKKLVQQGHP